MFEDVILPDLTLEQVERAEETLALISAHPNGWDQRNWLGHLTSDEFFHQVKPGFRFDPQVQRGMPHADANVCGTFACYAGWSCATSGYLVIHTEDPAYPTSPAVHAFTFSALPDKRTLELGEDLGEVGELAALLLGVEPYDTTHTWGTDGMRHPFDANAKYADLERFTEELRAAYETQQAAV